MSCLQRTMIENHKSYAKEICNFLYVNGKGKKGLQNHTIEEYQGFLEEMQERLFDEYNNAACEIGWIDPTEPER